MPGFTPADHARVSEATIDYERHKGITTGAKEGSRPKPRGLVRVMLLEEIGYGDSGIPDPVKGDFQMDALSSRAVLTQPTSVDYNGKVHYVVRCVASDQSSTPRTWQLRVIPPERGQGALTLPIDEHATGAEVAAAINSTGCPPCQVFGSECYFVDDRGQQINWPARQWHIIWTDNDWELSTQRYVDVGLPEDGLDYNVGLNEVPIALIPTAYAPTPWCEDVWLPYTTSFAAPSPGTFALCQVFSGMGLLLIDKECWTYVD